MDSPPKLAGETLIVHHIPLVHCQVSGARHCCSPLKRSNPFSCPENLGLSRTTSLPERDVLQREALLYSSLIQTSSSSLSSSQTEGGGGGDGGGGGGGMASDTSSFTSSNSEEPLQSARQVLPNLKPRGRANPLRHNPFLLNTEEEEGEEDEDDDDEDNLNGYLEDSSFHLHGNTHMGLGEGTHLTPFHLHELGFDPEEPFLLHRALEKPWCSSSTGHQGATVSRDGSRGGAFDFSARLESLDLLGLDGGQRRHGSSGSTLSMDCGEQDWGEEEEDEDHGRGSRAGSSGCSSSAAGPRCSCCDFSQPYPEPFSESQLGYGSDSSCNSSDGVLVNFSTIYNKMNNGGPAKPQINLNSSTQHSCSSSTSEPVVGTGGAENGDGGAFYLDLHTSPTEPTSQPLVSQETTDPTSSCGCPSKPQGTVEMDANCNSYHNHLSSEVLVPSDGSVNDLTSCLQSQARLVVATQNYYKLVTCDLSSQSSPSPAGSSVTSSSDEHSKGSPTQPTEYYLFRQPEEEDLEEGDEEDTELSQSEEKTDQCSDESDATLNVIEGQVYVNISPPMASRNVGGSSGGHQRSRSYDRNLDKSPTPRLGSLERMLSCPVRLSEGVSPGPPAPPRVTSFAEIARNKRKTGGSPSLRGGMEASTHSHSSGDFSPIPELHLGEESKSLPPLARSYSHGSCKQNGPLQESPGATHREGRTKAEGGLSCSSNGSPVVVRYSKDKRPTTLPIQPFTFQHQFGKAQSKPLLPLLNDYISHMQGRGGVAPEGGEEDPDEDHRRPPANTDAPSTTRPSPLGSYSPVRLHGAPSSGTCSTCTPSPDHGPPGGPRPPRSLSCPLSAGLMPLCTPPGARPVPDSQPKLAPLPPTPPPAPLAKGSPLVPVRPSRCFHGDGLASLPGAGLGPLGPVDSDIRHQTVNAAMQTAVAARQPNVHHLSPQALRWREYRRKNPLGLDRTPTGPLSGNLETRRGGPGHMTRRNVFDFPPSNPALGRLNGQSMRQLQQCYSDFLPDFFSQTELPPEEFCLSPDASSDDSISVDLLQKRGLVKAINKAVDLIVIHFGTSRDPGVKAKLGNSSVSPNIGHLILKYLCPAIREVLQDGLKAYVLDLIIGQRRNQPWSIVEASTQLGPSTRVLHSLYTKVCQYSELTNHSMRLNAFIFGLLNLRSLEFWFNHIYTHEDIVAAHYHPWGFLPLSQGPCQPLFEELLLLLQPLSLLPFDLDLLFEPHLLHEGQEHLRRKEQLCSAGQGLDQSARSTFQLMKGWGTIVAESKREEAGSKTDGAGLPTERFSLRREGTWHRMEGAASKRGVVEQSREGSGSESLVGSNSRPRNGNAGDIERGHRSTDRAKGVGGECQIEREEGEREGRRDRDSTSQAVGGARQRSRQAGWWYQLMQSSQVYIDNSTEGSKFVKWEKRKKLSMEGHRQSLPPPREGVVEGAEASQEVPEQVEQTQSNSSSNSSSRSKSSDGGYLSEPSTNERSRATRGRPSWMGSPPESVLSELKTNEKQPETQRPAQADGSGGGGETPTSGMRWGRLFGAGTTGRTEKAEQRSARTQRSSRLPSGWLSLDGSVLDFVVQTVGAGKILEPTASTNQSQELSPTQEAQEMVSQQSACEVRALCHHIASEAGQLSFQKGDVLRVLGRADADWLHCALGDEQGLVPIVYVTLKEENQGSQGPQ